MRWIASWIWIKDAEPSYNIHVRLRKEFDCEGTPVTAPFRITAESGYRLWVNGRFAGRGPPRSDPRYKYYDSHDLASLLQRGTNCIAAEVVCWGVGSCKNIPSRGGFLCEGEVRTTDGKNVKICSDRSWKVSRASEWKQEIRRVSRFQEFPDHYDARKAEPGWQRPGFPDSGWDEPRELGAPPVAPWIHLVQRDIPRMREAEMPPSRIVGSGRSQPAAALHYLPFEENFAIKVNDAPYLLAYIYPAESAVSQKTAMGQEGYAASRVRASRSRRARVSVGGGGLKKLLVNGSTVLDRSGEPRGRLSFHTVACELNEGWNPILLVVERGGELWEAAIHIEDEESGIPLRISVHGEESEKGASWYIGAPSWGVIETSRIGESDSRELRLLCERHGIEEKGLAWKKIVASSQPEDFPAPWYQAWYDIELPGETLGSRAEELVHPGVQAFSLALDGRKIAHITLDFGKEAKGFLALEVAGVDGGIVDCLYSERLSPDGRARQKGCDQVEDYRQWVDRYVMRDGVQGWESFSWKGFRYVDLIFRNLSRPVTIRSVKLSSRSYPVEPRGSFSCSDESLNRLWKTGAYSVELCMDDAYIDCPGREQGQYWGDARVQSLVNYYCFADSALVRKGILQIMQSQREDGLVAGMYPSDHDLLIVDYALFWIDSIWDYYLFVGGKELLESTYPAVTRVLSWFESNLDGHGLLQAHHWTFLDWAPLDKEGEVALLNCLYYGALEDGARISKVMGDGESAARYRKIARSLKTRINKRFWSEQQGLYVDAHKEGRQGDVMSQHANSMALLYDIAPRELRSPITAAILHRGDLVKASPYFMFYVLRALAHCEEYREVPSLIKGLWDRMLREGNGTFWEDWHGRNSLCHGWASAPTFALSAHILGVEPLARGFTRFRVKPQPTDLLWAHGIVPCPCGSIEVEWRKEGGQASLHVSVPEKTRAELWLPREWFGGKRITRNGKTLSMKFNANSALIEALPGGHDIQTL